LKKYAADKTKFFLRAGFHEVHRPFAGESDEGWEDVEPLPYLHDTGEHRRQLARYHQLIRRADRGVGEILNTLAAEGLADETLVVFLTDHGVPFPGAKLLLYDAGLEIAGILRAPGKIAAGSALDSLLSGVDVLPTLLELCGIPFDPNSFDGKSFAPALAGEAQLPRKYIHAERAMPVLMRAVRDTQFKYIVNFDRHTPQRVLGAEEMTTSLSMALPNTLRRKAPTEELYDLETDPWECTNLAGSDAYSEVKERMLAELRAWMRSTTDPILTRDIFPPNFEAAWRLISQRCGHEL